MVTQARRPLAERVEDIGAWYGILRAITYAAVVSNVFLLLLLLKLELTFVVSGICDSLYKRFHTQDGVQVQILRRGRS